MTNKIESLALAIARTCGAFNPQSEAFRLSNPGLLRAYSERHEAEGRLRKFACWQDGLRALCFDLEHKISGRSRAKVGPEDKRVRLSPQHTLTDIFALWAIKDYRKILLFLRRGLNDPSITEKTKLEYFA